MDFEEQEQPVEYGAEEKEYDEEEYGPEEEEYGPEKDYGPEEEYSPEEDGQGTLRPETVNLEMEKASDFGNKLKDLEDYPAENSNSYGS